MKGIEELPDGKVKINSEVFSKELGKNTFRKPVLIYIGLICLLAFILGLTKLDLMWILGGGIGIGICYYLWKVDLF